MTSEVFRRDASVSATDLEEDGVAGYMLKCLRRVREKTVSRCFRGSIYFIWPGCLRHRLFGSAADPSQVGSRSRSRDNSYTLKSKL